MDEDLIIAAIDDEIGRLQHVRALLSGIEEPMLRSASRWPCASSVVLITTSGDSTRPRSSAMANCSAPDWRTTSTSTSASAFLATRTTAAKSLASRIVVERPIP